jgi:hypothetical protein
MAVDRHPIDRRRPPYMVVVHPGRMPR